MAWATRMNSPGSSGTAMPATSPGQGLLQPVGEVLQIVKPLAQIGVGDLHHAALGLVAHLLHRCFGGEAAAHRLGDPFEPAAVGGEHPVGLDDVAVLAGAKPAAGVDEPIDRIAASPRPPGAAARARPRHPRRRPGGSPLWAHAGPPAPIARPGLRRMPSSRSGSEAPTRLCAISSGLTSSPLATSSATIMAIVCTTSVSSSV